MEFKPLLTYFKVDKSFNGHKRFKSFSFPENSYTDHKALQKAGFDERMIRNLEETAMIVKVDFENCDESHKINQDFLSSWLLKNDSVETSNEKKPFNFSSNKPTQEITTISQLRKVIEKHFPSVWYETECCLSAFAAISLKHLNGCPSLNLVGNPSGEKTTVLSFFYGQPLIYISDDFTPRSFVSHSANMKESDLKKVDMLPRIQNRILITPELAPLFEAPRDKLIDNFAMLTRVLDGEGLNRDSGTHGHRGYSGDYKFVWLGATTPLRASVWNVMGKIGNRLFFLYMRDKKRTNSDYVSMFSGEAYEKKVAICRGAVISFLNNLIHNHGVRTIEWDAKNDVLLLPDIVRYAQFLSKLRGTLMTWKSEERGEYEYSFPIIEEPPRAINALYNFAKGHALIHGRRYLIREDLEIVKSVCFSSMPYDRFRFLQLLAKHEGRITTQQIESELGCSNQTATRTMRIFEALGVVTVKSIQLEYAGVGRPMLFIEINSDFTELLRHAQAQDRNDGENNKIQQTNPARAAHDQIHSHPRKDGNYNLIHQNKPVLEEEYINSTSWDERILIHVPCSICEESPCNELNGKMFCKLHYLIEAIKNE